MFCVTFSFIYCLILLVNTYKVEVHVNQGTVIGITEESVFDGRLYYSFYGVPYAESPVNSLRFKNPQMKKSWSRPLDARTVYRGACAQPHVVHNHELYGVEDCLYLNIYSPHIPRKESDVPKPVIVWIHGFTFATSFSHIYGPDFFIDEDIVFVSLTHRIHVFGFLKLNESDENINMGLKDIVMGLKWIQKNIKHFGGDKNKVTVMGSGSGATFLSLILMTKHRKLFHKMILQSGSAFSPSIFQADSMVEKSRLKEELAKLTPRNIEGASTKDIIRAYQKVYKKKDLHKTLVPFSPLIEPKSNKSLITVDPLDFYNNAPHIDIPIMIGFTTQESISEVIPFLHNPHYLKEKSKVFKYLVPFASSCRYNVTSNIYPRIGAAIRNEYFKDGLSEKSISEFLKFSSDLLTYPVYKFIKTFLHNAKNKMYVYKFNYVGKYNVVKMTSTPGLNFAVKGAASGDEICYLLKCEPLWENYANISKYLYDDDRVFIKELTKLWANFAKTGDPTPPSFDGKYTWLPMTYKDDNVFLISKTKHRMINSRKENKMYLFWNTIYDTYFKHCIKEKHDEL